MVELHALPEPFLSRCGWVGKSRLNTAQQLLRCSKVDKVTRPPTPLRGVGARGGPSHIVESYQADADTLYELHTWNPRERREIVPRRNK